MTINGQLMTDVFPSEKPRRAFAMQSFTQTVLVVLVSVLVIGPLSILILTSFNESGVPVYSGFSFTLSHYASLFSNSGTGRLVWNTFIYAGCSVILGITIAVIIAWLTERTDLPGRTTIRIMMFSWMAIPPLVFAYGWILLINPGSGVINVIIRSLGGSGAPTITPYSLPAMIMISGLILVPTAFVMISGLLRNMDPALEDAGYVLGAPRWRTAQKITLPLLTPGLLSIGVFLTMAMVQTFDIPLILGMTAQVPVISIRIFVLASPDTGTPNYGLSSAFGVCLLVMALLLMLVYFRAIRLSERFSTVSGRGFRPKRVKLRGPRKIAAAGFVSAYFLVMLLPMLVVLWTSLLPFYRVPTLADLGNLSLDAYGRVLSEPFVQRAIVNTLIVVTTSATLVVLVSCLISWFSVRSKGRGGRALDLLAFSPMAIPPIVMATALLMIFVGTPLYRTIWVLVIGYSTVYLAFATRTLNGGLVQIHKELEDAAVVSGAKWLTSLRLVVFSIMWPHILNTWLWVMAQSARDLTIPLIMLTSTNVVAASAIYMLWNQPDQSGAAALSIVMVLALLAIVVPIQIYIAKKLDHAG